MINKEKRYIKNVEGEVNTRALKDGDNLVLEGYASVFNSPSRLLFENNRMFNEIIEPTAFNEVIKRDDLDVLLTYQHNGNEVLARLNLAKNVNTLELSVDDKGLKFRAVLPNTSTARDTWENVRAGNLYECSFIFTVDSDGERWDKDNEGNHIRYISNVSGLYDASIVVNGAYENTDIAVAARSFANQLREESEPATGDTGTTGSTTTLPIEKLSIEDKAELFDKMIEVLKDIDVEEEEEGEEVINERELDKMFIELMKLR